jgi:hypothetical protein
MSDFRYSTAPACYSFPDGCYEHLRWIPDGQPIHLRGIRTTLMSTAIVMIYTKDGFVAASDGFGNTGKGAPSLIEQKLFDVVGQNFTLIYGLSGAVSLIDKDANGNEIDCFKPIYSQVASELQTITIPNLEEYADLFIGKLGNRIHKEIINTTDRWADDPHTLKVQFAGYFQGVPGMAERTLTYQRSGFSVPCKITCSPARFATSSYVGYDKLAALLAHDVDDEFRDYRIGGAWKNVWEKNESISLEDAVDAAKKYIIACSSEEARKFDPNKINTIGGKLSLATLTPRVTWVCKPF